VLDFRKEGVHESTDVFPSTTIARTKGKSPRKGNNYGKSEGEQALGGKRGVDS